MTITEADMDKWINKPLGKEIDELLRPIFDNDEFVLSALVFCESIEERQKLINEIKAKNITKYSDVVHTISEIRKGNI